MPILEAGLISGYDRDKTAIYLWQELANHNVVYDYSTFIQHFPEDLKRKYSKSGDTPHLQHDYIKLGSLSDGALVRKCACGKYEINGMPADLQIEIETTPDQDARALLDVERIVLPKSIILEANKTVLNFLDVFKTFVKEFDVKCRNPKILKDLENDMTYKDVARMCISLQHLYEPPLDKMFHEGAAPSIMNQMLDETNFRAPVTMYQKALCYLLQDLTTYRQWAHKLSISPRQHQRIRERLEDWAPKKAEKIIKNVAGSHECPSCEFNLISMKEKYGVTVTKDVDKMNNPKPRKIIYGDKAYEVPKKYEKRGMNPIDVAYEIFAGKIKMKI